MYIYTYIYIYIYIYPQGGGGVQSGEARAGDRQLLRRGGAGPRGRAPGGTGPAPLP